MPLPKALVKIGIGLIALAAACSYRFYPGLLYPHGAAVIRAMVGDPGVGVEAQGEAEQAYLKIMEFADI